MSDFSSIQPDPSMIGGVSKAPFVCLPDPSVIFVQRAARFTYANANGRNRALSRILSGHSRKPKPASSCPTCRIVSFLTQLRLPAPASLRCRRSIAARSSPTRHLVKTLRASARSVRSDRQTRYGRGRAPRPPPRRPEGSPLERMIANVLADSIPFEAVAEHVYVAAALQIHFARLAARLDGATLVPVGVGVCSRSAARTAGGVDARRLRPGAEGLQALHCLLRTLRDLAVERGAGQMPGLRLDQGCRLPGG